MDFFNVPSLLGEIFVTKRHTLTLFIHIFKCINIS